MDTDIDNLVTFYRVLPGGLKPRRASESGVGTLPAKQFQYCEPSRLATSYGYYVFLPLDFSISWDGGRDAYWSFDDEATWYHLTTAAYPDSMRAWDSIAPDNCKGYCPSFLNLNEDQSIQMWTGWFARTAPGYSLLVRPPVNLHPSNSWYMLEGMIETDRWFGPLFTNIRITRPNDPIKFDSKWPFMQVVPVHRDAYSNRLLDKGITVQDGIPDDLWQVYHKSLIDKPQQHGVYAKEVRRRRAAEERGEPSS